MSSETPTLVNDGFEIVRGLFDTSDIVAVHRSILSMAGIIGGTLTSDSVDKVWFSLANKDRGRAGLLYNAMKHSVDIRQLSINKRLLGVCCGMMTNPSIVDVNFRIDAPGEDKYLFGWHQDYWFSMCSTDAIVAWIPLVHLNDHIGGVELLPYRNGERKVYKAKRGQTYDSYSNSIILDEEVDLNGTVRPQLQAGDVLFFRFDVLHRSLPNIAKDRCRWTIQIRLADLCDPQFMAQEFKPGIVTPNFITYLDGPKV